MELFQPWSLPHDSSEEMLIFNNFVGLLNRIEDLEFVCETCMNALTVDLSKMQALLNYASDRVKKTDVRVSNLRLCLMFQCFSA
jgi:hypothetical protein